MDEKTTTGGFGDLGPDSKVFRAKDFPWKVAANGSQGRSILKGKLVTGEIAGIHASVQPEGAVPSPLHRIGHTEFICVNEGTLEFEHDGKVESVGPGGILYIASGTVHHVRNAGKGPAAYTVVAIGGDAWGGK